MPLKNREKGFSLVELMTIVGVVILLSQFALPSYASYTKRSYVMEGLTLANSAKLAVAAFHTTEGYLPNGSAVDANQNALFNLAEPNQITGVAVNSIRVNDGIIIIEYNQKLGEFLGGPAGQSPVKGWGRLSLAPVTNAAGNVDNEGGTLVWLCGRASPRATMAGYTTVDDQYLPANCRA